ncbi:peptidoglycan D,D-transpeptidase FtsI family protein [Alicyclobacillus tolerans]|uniref:peptidoglycan D,D-transpeptidase FtsI family protein n=1 Tax=Alicyclobacillus tolerans TaxID=90970 RepID=UPI003B7E037E
MLEQEDNLRLKRLPFIYLLVFLAMLGLVIRLGVLQIVHRQEYKEAANQVQYTKIPLLPRRGYLYDAHMRLLAYNQPVYNLVYMRVAKMPPLTQKQISQLAKGLGVAAKPLQAAAETEHTCDDPAILLEALNEKQIAYVSEHQSQYPGLRIVESTRRCYPYGPLAGHLLGYVHPQSPEEVAYYQKKHYLSSQRVGLTGVEESYEALLQGSVGYEVWKINPFGIPTRLMGVDPQPQAGQSLRLTFDSRLQAEGQNLVAQEVQRVRQQQGQHLVDAEAVMLDVHTGAVKMMISYPYIDPNWFVNPILYKKHSHYLNNPILTPAINHSLSSPRYPGSTVKPVNIIAGLMNHVITPSTTIFDEGHEMVGTYNAHDWKWNGHGLVDAKRAIEVSCDTFMYDLGMWLAEWHDHQPAGEKFSYWYTHERILGLQKLFDWEWKFGLGPKTGIDLPGEVTGRFYTDDVIHHDIAPYDVVGMDKAIAKGKFLPNHGLLYDNAFAAIGQMQEFTPLQLAVSAMMIANGGEFITPHIVDAILTPDGKKVVQTVAVQRHSLHIPKAYMRVVQEGMEAATTHKEGTATRFFVGLAYKVAGKTGTAEISQFGKKTDISLFIGYAPAIHPQVAIAVMVPGSAGTSDAAVPLAKKLLDAYFCLSAPHGSNHSLANDATEWLQSFAYRTTEEAN